MKQYLVKEKIEIIHVKTQTLTKSKWNYNKLLDYFKETERKEIFNQVSLEISNYPELAAEITSPGFVQKIDWIDLAWKNEFPLPYFQQIRKYYPRIQKYIVSSVKYSYLDFHFDMSGASVWFYLITGKKYYV
jgi:lysine-specific demethylase PHF8